MAEVAPGTRPVLRMTGIGKRFGTVQALSEVDFRLLPGEIHALLGENGAGKSTLIKALTGVYDLDTGSVELDGTPVRVSNPHQAQRMGISTVYQEVNLCPNLTVAENIFLGRELTGPGGVIRWRKTRRVAAELLARFGLTLDVGARLGSYPLAVQQLVAIARAVEYRADGSATDRDGGSATKVLILDEPTSSLDRDEVRVLFSVMRRLRDEGVAIVFVSHFLDQIYEICDRMTILRNGRLVGEYRVADLDRVGLVRLMIGKELGGLEALAETDRPPVGDPVLRAEALGRRGGIAPFDLELHASEVVGLAGLLGSGRTELARLLFGADAGDSGRLAIAGEPVVLRGPHTAIARGVAFCSENRRAEGIIPDLTVRENIILAMQAARGWLRPVPRDRVDDLVARFIAALDIRPADPELRAGALSGGNQQKILLARWLITQPRLLILDEPTRGIDVGAKAEIQKLVAALAADGLAVLYISAELEEVLRLSRTIGVLRDRSLVARLDNGAEVTEEHIMRTIASGAHR
ncbi:sugar ABC transporter ATP-binding protein [Planosporangium mesophilum]|uniref:Sugar ABC transporter ATP-binding protein n=1 Tax=Planosporangium mesophilum TaxID=689768 RepID=A0A8J3TFJ9_9ACTN|nr:sugar ABC transporter ATP-binding protein [Planosporangium mesophilum]NJC86375.1 sugar ABC transporter ATP-binding protein [Planosporangium mesophilum]GII25988.1 sugar ABC transporter ATP-binding protein [Planosporangium mesophilum]